jgi:putative hydrolase of the HAD superfamily
MLEVLSEQEIIKPKAVIFDTDNTLYLYKSAHQSAINAIVVKAEKLLGVNRKTFVATYNYSRSEIKRQLGKTASSHSRLLYFQRTIENLGFGTRIFLTLDLEQTYWREFLANTRLFTGVQGFLQQLKSTGVKTANITDLTAQIQFRKMVYFGLDEYFDYVVTSEEVGHDKPSIESFNMALKKLNLLPHEVWMIGDDGINDIQGAKQAGIMTFHKANKSNKSFGADIVFDNFSDLCRYYTDLN